jgi:hypothetical protein
VQWFWIVPRLWHGKQDLSILLPDGQKTNLLLSEIRSRDDYGFFDDKERTPLERVLSDDDTT